MSSVWYMKKRGKFLCVYKRHVLLLAAIAALLVSGGSPTLVGFSAVCTLLFLLILLREEIIFSAKTLWEMLATFPFLVAIEMAHAAGSCAGLVKFVILPAFRRKISASHL